LFVYHSNLKGMLHPNLHTVLPKWDSKLELVCPKLYYVEMSIPKIPGSAHSCTFYS